MSRFLKQSGSCLWLGHVAVSMITHLFLAEASSLAQWGGPRRQLHVLWLECTGWSDHIACSQMCWHVSHERCLDGGFPHHPAVTVICRQVLSQQSKYRQMNEFRGDADCYLVSRVKKSSQYINRLKFQWLAAEPRMISSIFIVVTYYLLPSSPASWKEKSWSVSFRRCTLHLQVIVLAVTARSKNHSSILCCNATNFDGNNRNCRMMRQFNPSVESCVNYTVRQYRGVIVRVWHQDAPFKVCHSAPFLSAPLKIKSLELAANPF